MAEPFTLATVAVMAALAREISIANGFHTDAGLNVAVELQELPSDDGVARLFVLESNFTRTGRALNSLSGEQTIVFEGYIPARKADAERIAHGLRADLLRLLCRIQPSAFASVPAQSGVVSKFDLADDCAIKRRIDGVDYVVVQVSAKLICAVYF